MNVSKTQIDKLGERLKKGSISEDDLRLLDVYRRSFTEAYEFVVGAVRKELGLEPTGRPAKSTTSISEKLKRESIRLTQIQDIAGCRLIVADIASQDQVVQSLGRLFEKTSIVDRRQKPSHGYRAVHVIVTHLGKMVEIQVRTEFQHLWAEFSEKASDVMGSEIKYGGGDKETRKLLVVASETVDIMESTEADVARLLALESKRSKGVAQKRLKVQRDFSNLKKSLFELLRDSIESMPRIEGEDDDIPN